MKIQFLSGLPRSGSTLLGSLLNQNPSVYVSPTSPLLDLLCLQNEALERVKIQYTFDQGQVDAVYRMIPEAFYSPIQKPLIIDKHRAWPKNITPAKTFVNPNPKIICTIRPIPEVIVSFLRLLRDDPDNFIDKALRHKHLPLTTENRAKELWTGYISDPYSSIRQGQRTDKHCLLMVKYDDLINDPGNTLNRIYDFLEVEPYQHHTFDRITNTCAESKDAAWGLKNLHVIRPKLEKTSEDPMQVLGANLFYYFSQYNLK